MVKVESLNHIPRHLAFHKPDQIGAYADVYINEIWDIDNPSFTLPSLPPRSRHLPTRFRYRRDNRAPALSSIVSSSNTSGQAISLNSNSSRTIPGQAATLFLMGNRARRTLQQNANSNIYDLLAFLAQTTKMELQAYPRHTPHASVAFEQGAYHVRLELSPCRVVESWILVAQVDHVEEPTFPCYNILTRRISRE